MPKILKNEYKLKMLRASLWKNSKRRQVAETLSRFFCLETASLALIIDLLMDLGLWVLGFAF